MDDHQLSADLAVRAGRLLHSLASSAPLSSSQQTLGARGDRASQELLQADLARYRPRDAVLSEESADSAERLSADRVWIVDPLDGTREFAEMRFDWAVHVALWERGELRAGAVALPAQGQLFHTGCPVAVPERAGQLRIAVSRTRAPSWSGGLSVLLGASLHPMGSAGAKAMAILQGHVDVYVHTGGQYEWDSAAPVAVARAAGLHTSRLDGTSLRYNQQCPYLPDLVICRQEIADRVLAALAETLLR